MSLRTDLTLRLIKRSFDKRFRLARLTRLPGLGKAMDYALFRGDDIIILPKDQVYQEMAHRTKIISMDVQVEKQDVMLPSQMKLGKPATTGVALSVPAISGVVA